MQKKSRHAFDVLMTDSRESSHMTSKKVVIESVSESVATFIGLLFRNHWSYEINRLIVDRNRIPEINKCIKYIESKRSNADL